MMKRVLLGLLLVGSGGLVGCSSTGDTSDEVVNPDLIVVEEVKPEVTDDASTSAASRANSADSEKLNAQKAVATYTGHPLDNPASPLARKVVYFDFDQSVINDEDKVTLNAHADYLIANPVAHVRLEGHADERGTREYNVALGERRAGAVKRYLTLKGVAASQLNMISYGEERPAKRGHDEGSWALNRRVELVYTKR
ncbi:MAG: peptidoglycan-associated lipoprotein Pal [Gammaproteobacteria bacterium]|nr:peptidoglycan-associated lipoprotein Pal [Gammaproteobacteria bacterium]MCF6229401.1 peptidoglycan-associated lipoprotein Pal [Gammaproteobacteria bacterium]